MANKYYSTIGLEIHAELKTQTKMFCGCKNNPDEEKPNTNICPVCMAHPGALPVINKKAIENVIKVGLAVDGMIADFTEFDRKNYFYPDIPKGYQISQYKFPIVSGGHLAGMDITRVHLEEDTANNKHDRGDFSLIDFNRAGVPLMELVTEAHTFESVEDTAKTATKFAKEFQLILWYLDVSEANMEKGEMRVEVNISISKDKSVLGTKVEVKNLNSFKSVDRAIRYELERMTNLFKEGKEKEIVQETRGWDDGKQKTFSQRKKEGSSDYRYFPDPDLPKMYLHGAFSAQGGSASGGDFSKMRAELPELPEAKRTRYKKDFGIKDEDIEMYVNNSDFIHGFEYVGIGDYFEKIVKQLSQNKTVIQLASNYLSSDLIGVVKNLMQQPNENNILHINYPSPENFAELINMVSENKISSRGAKDILAMIVLKDESPLKIATERGLLQSNDESVLKKIITKIISESPEIIVSYKAGKENAIMSLVGKVIKESKGSANPQMVIEMLKEMLK